MSGFEYYRSNSPTPLGYNRSGTPTPTPSQPQNVQNGYQFGSFGRNSFEQNRPRGLSAPSSPELNRDRPFMARWQPRPPTVWPDYQNNYGMNQERATSSLAESVRLTGDAWAAWKPILGKTFGSDNLMEDRLGQQGLHSGISTEERFRQQGLPKQASLPNISTSASISSRRTGTPPPAALARNPTPISSLSQFPNPPSPATTKRATPPAATSSSGSIRKTAPSSTFPFNLPPSSTSSTSAFPKSASPAAAKRAAPPAATTATSSGSARKPSPPTTASANLPSSSSSALPKKPKPWFPVPPPEPNTSSTSVGNKGPLPSIQPQPLPRRTSSISPNVAGSTLSRNPPSPTVARSPSPKNVPPRSVTPPNIFPRPSTPPLVARSNTPPLLPRSSTPPRPTTPPIQLPYARPKYNADLVHPKPTKPANWRAPTQLPIDLTPIPSVPVPPGRVRAGSNPPPNPLPSARPLMSSISPSGTGTRVHLPSRSYSPPPLSQPIKIPPIPRANPNSQLLGYDPGMPDNKRGGTIRYTGMITNNEGQHVIIVGQFLLEVGYRVLHTGRCTKVWVETEHIPEDAKPLIRKLWEACLIATVALVKYGRIVKPSFEMGARLMPMVDGRLKTDTHQLAQNLITFENNCKLCAEATRRFKTSIDALVHAGRIVHQDFVEQGRRYPDPLRIIMSYITTIHGKLAELTEAWLVEAESRISVSLERRASQDRRWRPYIGRRQEAWLMSSENLEKTDLGFLKQLIAWTSFMRTSGFISEDAYERQLRFIQLALPTDHGRSHTTATRQDPSQDRLPNRPAPSVNLPPRTPSPALRSPSPYGAFDRRSTSPVGGSRNPSRERDVKFTRFG